MRFLIQLCISDDLVIGESSGERPGLYLEVLRIELSVFSCILKPFVISLGPQISLYLSSSSILEIKVMHLQNNLEHILKRET